ncbi:aminotransferase class I/II-fold pyridoxal phosphate-dependent enzyme [Alteromonas sp. C1M14]|uniref:pyridoxal phosphate-dependent aminotransferase n=1 Tax=Alteromonas sp. C1M14 TaxID=2841567 RepID=UPI001C096396|nr:aminotransferase class I/II-fold pyridoxal phosphate-dependent enzyme [Alteromonas sp. C1M14]MBU2979889.1 aminotransferase class I/II-fold pyridoxal phosphate-dependent enzyme [Alteromonas sp. C1M14]
MRYAPLTQAIQGETVDAWDIHFKATALKETDPGVIILSIGDPDFDTPPAVVEAAVSGLRQGDTHYVEIEGRDPLRREIARQHQVKCGQLVSKDNVILLAGAQNALFSTSLCILAPGDEAIVLQPMYVTYEACIQLTGAKLVPVAMDKHNNFRLDADALANAITDKTRAIFFATPNNPSGVMLNRQELQFIADIAIKHDLWVVSDEVYSQTVFDGEHLSIAGFDGMAERTVTLNSLSKSYAMTGWRAGWAIAPETLTKHMSNLSLCMLYGLPGFVQQAAYAALTDKSAVAASQHMRDTYQRRRDTLVACFKKHKNLSCVPPEASMFLLVNVSQTGLNAQQFAEALLEFERIGVLPATAFGQCASDYIRISYVVDDEQLADACERIDRFMARFA